MIRALSCLLAASFVSPVLAQTAAPAPIVIDSTYLTGRWVVGEAATCSDTAGEMLVFNADGTFDATHLGRSTSTGYWELTPQRLELDVLSAPKGLEQTFGVAMPAATHFRIIALLFDASADEMQMVAAMADQIRGADLKRCP